MQDKTIVEGIPDMNPNMNISNLDNAVSAPVNQSSSNQMTPYTAQTQVADNNDSVSGLSTSVVTNSAQAMPLQAPRLAWDKDSVIRRATTDFIHSLPRPITQSNEELRDGLTNAILDAIDERNIVIGGAKIHSIQNLPNASIASMILAKYEVRCISWTGSSVDNNMLAIYEESGKYEGTYVDAAYRLPSIVHDFKFTAEKKDVEEIFNWLYNESELAAPESDPDLIPFHNGIFNYKTKQLLPFSPNNIFVRKYRANYITGSAPACPQIVMPDGVLFTIDDWFKTLSSNPEIVKLLYMVVGALLRPNVRWDKVVCFYATEGLNGKGTLCELCRQICGEGNYAPLRIADFAKDSKLEQLIRANAVIADENAVNDFVKDVSNFKNAVTNDTICIDIKFKKAMSFKFSGLIIECLNSLSKTGDHTLSFTRRNLIIPFDSKFSGVERKYIKSDYIRRQEVIDYLATKVMNLPDYYELPEPDACKQMLDYYKEYNDPVRQFVDEVFPRFTWNKVPQTFVYDCYSKWCARFNPSGKTMGKFVVMDRIRSIVKENYPDQWTFNAGTVKINQKDNLNPELLITDLGLEDWRSSTYKGTDPAKISMPNFKESYANVFIKL